MDGLGTGVEAIVDWIRDMMDKLRPAFSALFQVGTRAVCEELMNLAVADFMATSVDTFDAFGAGFAPAGEAISFRCTTLMDFDVVRSGSVPFPADVGNVDAFGKLWLTSLVT